MARELFAITASQCVFCEDRYARAEDILYVYLDGEKFDGFQDVAIEGIVKGISDEVDVYVPGKPEEILKGRTYTLEIETDDLPPCLLQIEECDVDRVECADCCTYLRSEFEKVVLEFHANFETITIKEQTGLGDALLTFTIPEGFAFDDMLGAPRLERHEGADEMMITDVVHTGSLIYAHLSGLETVEAGHTGTIRLRKAENLVRDTTSVGDSTLTFAIPVGYTVDDMIGSPLLKRASGAPELALTDYELDGNNIIYHLSGLETQEGGHTGSIQFRN